MAFILSATKKDWVPAPEGLHHAVCVDIHDLGIVETKFGLKPKVDIWWQIDELNPESGKRYGVRARFTASLHEKALLRQMLETWRGRKFSADELKGFDLEKLLGANCQVQIVHTTTDDGTVWADVKAVVPAPRGAGKLEPEAGYVRLKDRTNGHGTQPTAGASEMADEDSVPF